MDGIDGNAERSEASQPSVESLNDSEDVPWSWPGWLLWGAQEHRRLQDESGSATCQLAS